MDNPSLWFEVNTKTCKEFNEKLFEKYISSIKWKQIGGDEILDIGCGTGDFTSNKMLPNFPKTISKIFATDVNPKMIEFASKTYSNNPKLEFGVLDIAKEVPQNLYGRFDHVFSSYAMHWIKNQKLVFQNIYNMLKPIGDTLFWMIADEPQVCASYIEMAQDPEWSKYLTNIEDGIPVYRKEEFPEKALRKNLEESGFKVGICEKISVGVEFPDEDSFKDFLESINPFVKNMPEEVKKKYMPIHVEKVKKENIKNNQPEKLHFLEVLVAYAYKES